MKLRLTGFLSWIAGLFLLMTLVFIFQDIFTTAFNHLSFNFLIDEPMSAGRKGGIYPMIVSTLMILGISLLVVLPIGLACSMFLSEYEKEHSITVKITRTAIEILAGVPSIVFGLFGNAIFSIYFGMGFSILSGGLTLALMCLPLFIKTVEESMRSTPKEYKLVATSLGLSKKTTFTSIILPHSLPAIVVGIVLSVGRALAETAALIFTAGYVDRIPDSVFDSGRSLSVHIYDLAMNVPGGNINAYNTAFVLVAIIIIINSTLNLGLSQWSKKRIKL